MIRARPVPAQLWARLAALDHRCDLELRREDVGSGGAHRGTGRLYSRKWVVRVRERGYQGRAITAEAPTLVQALECAVAESEQRGWASSDVQTGRM